MTDTFAYTLPVSALTRKRDLHLQMEVNCGRCPLDSALLWAQQRADTMGTINLRDTCGGVRAARGIHAACMGRKGRTQHVWCLS